MMTVLIFASHPEDLVLGAGGTIAKYLRDKKKVIPVIFSYGEIDLLIDPDVAEENKINESKRAFKILGVKEFISLEISDKKLNKIDKKIIRQVKELIIQYKPKMIFTHTFDDIHPANRNVAGIVRKAISKLKSKPDMYSFKVGTPIRLNMRDHPRRYVPIKTTINSKKRAINALKSQKAMLSLYSLLIIFLQNRIYGYRAHSKYAESFYKW